MDNHHFFCTIFEDGRNKCGIHRTVMQCKMKIPMLCWDASSMHRYLGPIYPNENKLCEFALIWVTWFIYVYTCCMGYIPEYHVCLLIQERLLICDLAITDQNNHILKLENHLSHIHYGLYFLTQRS